MNEKNIITVRPRLYLFHGNDNNTSLGELIKWQNLFQKKYPDGNLVYLDALEISNAGMFIDRFKDLVNGRSLFSSHQIIIIKDIYILKKVSSTALWKIAEALIKNVVDEIDQDLTLVFWERRLLNFKDGLYKYFLQLEKEGFSKIQLYNLESVGFDQILKNELRIFEKTISKDSYIWLKQQYVRIGLNMRKSEGLRGDQGLIQDERNWWLKNMLKNCMEFSLNHELQVNDFILTGNIVEENYGSFDLVNALQNNDMDKAMKIVKNYIETKSDSGDIYLIFGALRWMMRQKVQNLDQAAYGLKLLGQIELFAKNGILNEYDLLIQFMTNWEINQKTGEEKDLIDLRKVWLASLPRSLT